jgi:hypothetical protein
MEEDNIAYLKVLTQQSSGSKGEQWENASNPSGSWTGWFLKTSLDRYRSFRRDEWNWHVMIFFNVLMFFTPKQRATILFP